jgi:hypothetical protein
MTRFIENGQWFTMPDGTPVQAVREISGLGQRQLQHWRFNLSDGTPLLMEDKSRPGDLLLMVKQGGDDYATALCDLTLDDLTPALTAL